MIPHARRALSPQRGAVASACKQASNLLRARLGYPPDTSLSVVFQAVVETCDHGMDTTGAWSCAATIAKLDFFAHRVQGPKGSGWHKVPMTDADALRANGLALNTLKSYFSTLCDIVTTMAGVPVIRWDESTLTRCFTAQMAPETHRRRVVLLRQWRAYLGRTGLADVLQPWRTPTMRDEAKAPRLMLSPHQVDGVLRALRRHKRYGRAFLLLAILMLGFRLRVTEAATRLWSDLDPAMTGLFVNSADTKTKHKSWRPCGYLPAWAIEELAARWSEARAETRERGTHAPLIPGMLDTDAMNSLVGALNYELGKYGLTTHDFRHLGVTLDVLLAVALQTGTPPEVLPPWADRHRHTSNALRLAGAGANHSSDGTTADSYSHCGLWAQARYLTVWHDTQTNAAQIQMADAALLLGYERGDLTRRLRAVGCAPTRTGKTNVTNVNHLSRLLRAQDRQAALPRKARNERTRAGKR